jgi:O-antigen ligase
MIRFIVTSAVATTAVVAFGLLVVVLRRARAAGDLGPSALLTFGMGWLISLPVAMVAISGGISRRPDVFHRRLVTVLPGWYPTAIQIATVLTGILAVALVFKVLASRGAAVHVAGILAVILWAIAQFASALHGEPVLSSRTVVLFLCLIAASVLPKGRGAVVGAAAFGVSLAIASGILAVFRYNVAFVVPCKNQCGILGLAFTGVLANENLLGIALAAAVPFVLLGFRGRGRLWLALYLTMMAIMTGSRTAGIAASIAFIAFAVLRPRLDDERTSMAPGAIAGLLLVGALLASTFVTQYARNDFTLSGRQQLWRVASAHIGKSPWFGNGPEEWPTLYDSSEIPFDARRSAHNQWMDVLFVAGWVGAGFFVATLLAVIASAGRARTALILTTATLLIIGTAEGTISIGAVDFMSFAFVALLLAGPPAQVTQRDFELRRLPFDRRQKAHAFASTVGASMHSQSVRPARS